MRLESTKPANGIEGHVIATHDGIMFRVYAEDGTFIDYKWCHSDLCVTISDEDATFYHYSDDNVLDHCEATLGLK